MITHNMKFRDSNKKVIEIQEMALFLTLKKVVQSTCRALPLQLQKCVKCHKLPPTPRKKEKQSKYG